MNIKEREKPRSNFIIPVLLHDEKSGATIKAVMLDISSKGIRVFSNDKRLLLMNEDVLKQKSFRPEFDFFDIDTRNLRVKVANIAPGENAEYERQMGLAFLDLDVTLARQIDVFVQEHGRHD